MTNFEKIEAYVENQFGTNERSEFEAQLKSDPSLAAEVAFYVQAKQAARQEALARRKAEWAEQRPQAETRPLRTWLSAAASVLVMLGLGWYLWQNNTQADPQQMAAAYVQENLTQLSLTMDSKSDSLSTGKELFNKGQFKEATKVFEAVLRRHPTDSDALKLSGMAYLKQGQYDQAIARFHALAEQTNLYENPGKFYEALTLLLRNRPFDKKTAQKLLQEVVSANLEGKTTAVTLLKTLE